MSTSVDFETAKELRDAGFPQPWPMDGAWECFEDKDGKMYAPTALEIIDQMPFGTYPCKNADGLWYVWFELPGYQRDFRHDACPHIAAAKAFIAWKRGTE